MAKSMFLSLMLAKIEGEVYNWEKHFNFLIVKSEKI